MVHDAKKKSLQAIDDFYFRKGLRGEKLRKAVERDPEYKRILGARHAKLTKDFAVRPGDRKKYVLSNDQDYEILAKIYTLEKKKLSKQDTVMVQLMRTQLEHNWREPMLKFLNRLVKKYR